MIFFCPKWIVLLSKLKNISIYRAFSVVILDENKIFALCPQPKVLSNSGKPYPSEAMDFFSFVQLCPVLSNFCPNAFRYQHRLPKVWTKGQNFSFDFFKREKGKEKERDERAKAQKDCPGWGGGRPVMERPVISKGAAGAASSVAAQGGHKIGEATRWDRLLYLSAIKGLFFRFSLHL